MAEGTTVTMFPADSQENQLAEEAAGVPHLLLHQEPTGITYQRGVYQLQRLINTAQEINTSSSCLLSQQATGPTPPWIPSV